MFERLTHVAIAVPSIEIAARQLQAAYGLTVDEYSENRNQGVRMAYVNVGHNMRIELLEPLTPDSAVGRFLERNPKGGFHHLSFSVPDMDATRAVLAQNAVEPISSPTALNVRIAFLHPKDFLGVLVEIEEHSSNKNS